MCSFASRRSRQSLKRVVRWLCRLCRRRLSKARSFCCACGSAKRFLAAALTTTSLCQCRCSTRRCSGPTKRSRSRRRFRPASSGKRAISISLRSRPSIRTFAASRPSSQSRVSCRRQEKKKKKKKKKNCIWQRIFRPTHLTREPALADTRGTITITKPAANAQLLFEQVNEIKFQTANIPGQDVGFFTQVVDSNDNVVYNGSPVSGQRDELVPTESFGPPGTYKLRVVLTSNNDIAGEKTIKLAHPSAYFTITEPTSATSWQTGGSGTVQWAAMNLPPDATVELFDGDQVCCVFYSLHLYIYLEGDFGLRLIFYCIVGGCKSRSRKRRCSSHSASRAALRLWLSRARLWPRTRPERG